MLEPCSHPYKFTIKIEPLAEDSKLPTYQEEFVMMKSEAEQNLFSISSDLKCLAYKFQIGTKVLIKEQSKPGQFGIIINKTNWGGFNIKFPNGLNERNDEHSREFYYKFLELI